MICAPCLLAAILLANLILISVFFYFFIFMRYPAGRGLHGESTGSIVAVNGSSSG